MFRIVAGEGSLFGRTLDRYWSQEAVARAEVIGIEYLIEKIRAVLASTRQGRVRVASIGCGSALEISALLERWPDVGPRPDVVLLDQDEGQGPPALAAGDEG